MTDSGTMMMGRIDDVERHYGWFIALGILFIFAGLIALTIPMMASVAVTVVVGWLFFVLGILQLLHAWQARGSHGLLWQGIMGVIILLGGISMLINPIAATVTLTLLLGAVFVAKGVVQVIFGFNYRPRRGWVWIVLAGILALIVGLIIIFAWPQSILWALGTIAGISLIFTGWSYLMIAVAARHVTAH